MRRSKNRNPEWTRAERVAAGWGALLLAAAPLAWAQTAGSGGGACGSSCGASNTNSCAARVIEFAAATATTNKVGWREFEVPGVTDEPTLGAAYVDYPFKYYLSYSNYNVGQIGDFTRWEMEFDANLNATDWWEYGNDNVHTSQWVHVFNSASAVSGTEIATTTDGGSGGTTTDTITHELLAVPGMEGLWEWDPPLDYGNQSAFDAIYDWTNTYGATTYTSIGSLPAAPWTTNEVWELDGEGNPYLEDRFIDNFDGATATSTVSLADEFTTATLKTNVLGLLGAAAYAGWESTDSDVARLTVSTNEYWADARKIKGRVVFNDTDPDTTYYVEYTVEDADGTTNRFASGAGNGGDLVLDLGEFIPAVANETITVTVTATYGVQPPAQNSSAPPSPGGPGPSAGSFRFDCDLGRGAGGQWAGRLMVHQESPSALLTTPQSLQFIGPTNVTELLHDPASVLRQVRTAQVLADIQPDGATRYHLRLYPAAQVGALSNGVYTFTGDPSLTWTIENADAQGSTHTNLRVLEVRGNVTITNVFEYDAGSTNWSLTVGNGLARHAVSRQWLTATNLLEVTSVADPATGQIRSQRARQYTVFPFGRRLVGETEGTGAITNGTTLTYYTDAENDGVNYGRLKQRLNSAGAWTLYTYTGNGVVEHEYSGFGDQGPTTTAALCRLTTHSYEPFGADDGTVGYGRPRQTDEYVLGTLLVTTTYEYTTNRTVVTRQPAGGDPLVTTTTRHASGDFAGHLASIAQPDGTLTLFDHATSTNGYRTNVVSTGEPNGGGTAIVSGSRRTSVYGPVGQLLSRTVVDIASGIMVGSEGYSDFDAFDRPQTVTYLDGGTRQFTYICCGIESETDPDGLVTVYGYDDLKRRVSVTRQGIAHLKVLDAAGRILQTIRQGTNGNQIVQGRVGYDVLNRVLAATNALGKVTTYAYAQTTNGNAVMTVTLPDGGTQITTRFLDGATKSLTGTGVHGMRYEYGVEETGQTTKEIKLLDNGSDSDEWVQHFTDGLGRSVATVYPDMAASYQYYNSAGQLWKTIDPDGVRMLYTYNARGEQEYQVLDFDRDDQVDLAGMDRVTKTVRSVGTATALSGNARITETYVWAADNTDTATLASRVEVLVDGTMSARSAYGMTNLVQRSCGATCQSTNTAPDGSYTVTTKVGGHVTTVTRYSADSQQLSAISYEYDQHGRQTTATDARNGSATLLYDDADHVTSVTTPVPGAGQSAQTTYSYYNDMGRVWRTVQPDGGSVTNEFHLTGKPKKSYGAREYPVEYTYDYAGRMATMKTWQNFAGNSGTATTTWNYDSQRGWLTEKRYHDNQGPDYTYTAAGRLATRTWARGIVTTYTFDNAGQLTSIDYDDSTPDVTHTYNRLGRQTGASTSNDAITYAYDAAGVLLAETHGTGLLDGIVVTNTYDALLRRQALTAFQPSAFSLQTSYAYDNASRLSTVSDGTNTAAYTYLANSPLIEQIAFTHNSTTNMVTTKAHDYLNRLTGVQSVPSASSAVSSTYAYNDANQRTAVTNEAGAFWNYGYDALGQVISGRRKWSDGTHVAGQQYEYAYDDIGSRQHAASGGDSSGANLRTNSYTANLLNQYTNRDVYGYLEVQGSANSNATVTVNNQSTYRKAEFFRKELTVSNSGAPVLQGITNVAVLAGAGTNGQDIVSTQTGSQLLQQHPESFTHDADGNLTQDGKWNYTWDAENRLIAMESVEGIPDAAKRKLEFAYDHQSRRISKKVSVWDTDHWSLTSDLRFLYDGWNLIAILDAQSSILQSFQWGTDLSGSMQGAGGVGGLLSMRVHSGTNTGVYFYAYDGNGNVASLVSAADGSDAARYEYSPFGQLLRATGPLAFENKCRFSTKYCDDETGFYYYGYRYYDPSTGRWLSRDPISELDGASLYAFVKNEALYTVDSDGRVAAFTVPKCNIMIFFGHNRAQAPRVPDPIKNEKCSAASVVACSGDCVKVDAEIPGIGPRPDSLINIGDAATLALDDFNKAKTHAAKICKDCCDCETVTISIKCYIDTFEYLLLPEFGFCSKKEVIKCKKK